MRKAPTTRLLLAALSIVVAVALSGCTADDEGNGTEGGGADDGLYATTPMGPEPAPVPAPPASIEAPQSS